MGSLTKDQILKADDLNVERVEVAVWGGYVNVRSLTARERDRFEQSIYKGRGPDRKENFGNLRARLVALTTVDDEGERVFSESDAEALGEKNSVALSLLFNRAQELSGMRAEDVEELTKNLETSHGEDSLSD